MKKAFTLLELLVVMGIMGLMGTLSIGGYRAMQRGMEERGVMQSVNTMIRAAYQRAQIDRQPVAIYFWNETLRAADADNDAIVAGHAVAIRRYGRFSDVANGCLVDEFADLDKTYQVQSSSSSSSSSSQTSDGLQFYIYPMEELSQIQSSTQLKRTLVSGKIEECNESLSFLSDENKTENVVGGTQNSNTNNREVPRYGFKIEDQGNVNWKQGMAYGMEFLDIRLPQNYIFGSTYSDSVETPIKEAGTIVFDVGVNRGGGLTTGGTMGRNTIDVYSIRQNGATMQAKKVASTTNPEERM